MKDKSSILTHVIQLKDSKKKLKQDLSAEEDLRNKYAGNIIKLENKCRDHNEQMEASRRDKQKLYSKIINLKDKLDEKEVTIANAEERLREANTKLKQMASEIDNLTEDGIRYKRDIEHLKCQPRDADQDRRYGHTCCSMDNHTNTHHGIHMEPTFSTMAITSKQGIDEKLSTDFPAVEEPDDPQVYRTDAAATACFNSSTSLVQRNIQIHVASHKDNPKDQQKQQMTISNTFDRIQKIAEEQSKDTVTRTVRSRRRPIQPKIPIPAEKTMASKYFGVNGNRQANMPVRHVKDKSTKALDSLGIFCSNSKVSSHE